MSLIEVKKKGRAYLEGKKDNDFGFEHADFQIIFFRNSLNFMSHTACSYFNVTLRCSPLRD